MVKYLDRGRAGMYNCYQRPVGIQGAYVDHVASGVSVGSANSFAIAITPAAGVPIGDLIVVFGGTATGAGAVSCADDRGNSYTQIAAQTATNPTGYIFVSKLTTALLTGDHITMSAGKVTWILGAEQFTGTGVSTTPDGAAVTATGSSLAPTATNPNQVSATSISLVLTVYNNITAYTEDSTNVGGGDVWHGVPTVNAFGSGRSVQGSYKITTSAVSQPHTAAIATSAAWSETMRAVDLI